MLAPGIYTMTLEGLVSHLQDLVFSLVEMGSLSRLRAKAQVALTEVSRGSFWLLCRD